MALLKNLFLYGGLDKETYCRIRSRITEENNRSVGLFTPISAVSFAFTAVTGLIKNPGINLSIYIVGAGIFSLMYILNKLGQKKYPVLSDFLAILFSFVLLFFGAFIAFNQINDRTTLLLPLFSLISLVFCYRPIYLVSILLIVEAAYLLIMQHFQAPDLFFVNAVNTCIFCAIGVISGLYTLHLKHKRYKVEYENQILLERDSMTGLYNRYSFNKEFEAIANGDRPVTICSFDVNGLKTVNDSLGHLAGDELIIGAAECISDVFGKFGNVYRIGGDEFCVLAYTDFDERSARAGFEERLKTWKGEMNAGISIALGIARLDHNCKTGIDAVCRSADEQMYASKKEYYIAHDRRNRSTDENRPS